MLNVPVNYERPPAQILPFYREVIRRIGELPGVETVAIGTMVPWRDAGQWFAAQFTVEGYKKADGEDDPRAKFRTVSPGFFRSLNVPIVAGRDFNADDRTDSEKVVIVSESLAKRMFPNQDALNRNLMWTDPVTKFIGVNNGRRRIVGVAADLDDENVVAGGDDHGVSPDGAGDVPGTLVRARQDRSVLTGDAGHQDHPRPFRGAAGGRRGDAGGCARRGACAESAERADLRRLRHGGADDCGGRRRRRAGVLGQRADARVWRPSGDWLDAVAAC